MVKFKTNINLLPREDLAQNPIGKFLTWALTFGRYIIIFTELIVILAFIFRFKLDLDLQKINSEVERKLAIIQSQKELENNIRLVQSRYGQVQKIQTENKISVKILEELAQITPLDVIFTNLSIKNDTLEIQGVGLSKIGISTFIYKLGLSGLFMDVNIESISSKDKNDNKITFSLTAKLNFTQLTVNKNEI